MHNASTAVGGVGFSRATPADPLAAHADKLKTKLSGFDETPATLSSPGSGEFEAQIKGKGDDATITWELNYRGLVDVLQAHIHFGQLNIHTKQFTRGEIRGQFKRNHGSHDGDGDDHRH